MKQRQLRVECVLTVNKVLDQIPTSNKKGGKSIGNTKKILLAYFKNYFTLKVKSYLHGVSVWSVCLLSSFYQIYISTPSYVTFLF